MAFFCQQCGECCSQMHQIHEIEEDCGNHTFHLRNTYTGERSLVTLDADKVHLFEDRSLYAEWPEACPFVRKDPSQGRICCTVHRSRPDLCREYGCWRLLILDPVGKRLGRILGSRHLSTEDAALRQLWDNRTAALSSLEEDEWEEAVFRLLVESGYRVFR
jgi:hypothetical protein